MKRFLLLLTAAALSLQAFAQTENLPDFIVKADVNFHSVTGKDINAMDNMGLGYRITIGMERPLGTSDQLFYQYEFGLGTRGSWSVDNEGGISTDSKMVNHAMQVGLNLVYRIGVGGNQSLDLHAGIGWTMDIFGKSYAVQMLCAYYDCQCDSHELFDNYAVSQSVDYETHINQYNVLTFDVTNFISTVKRTNGHLSDVPDMIAADLRSDMVRAYPKLADVPRLEDCLLECVRLTGRKFVFIIDEWDALIREAKHDHATQEAYLNLLRGLFKNNDVTPYVVAAAYMTGILPIKKDGSQSAISDFREYSVLNPGSFAEYVGFTEAEVKTICQQYDMDFDEAKKWYNGYSFDTVQSIYNPYSVMLAMEMKAYEPYWRQTSAADSLVTFINMDFDGLQEDIMRLSAGESLIVNTSGFQNTIHNSVK